MDAFSRALSLHPLRSIFSCMCAFDLRSAFPSVAHSYLFAVLAAAGLPEGMLTAIRTLYMNCDVISGFGPTLIVYFTITAGVLQGCPLSSSLFVLAMNPFFVLASRGIESGDFIGGCADDVASVTRHLSSLQHIVRTFCKLRSVANLALNAKKIQLTPLGMPFRIQSLETFRDRICMHVPELCGASCAFHVDYLGFTLGPRSSELVWKKPLEKYESRFAHVVSSHRPPSLVVPIYNMSVVSVLSYVCQFIEFPPHFHRKELHRLHRLFRFIPLSLPLAAFAHCGEVGLPEVLLLRPYALAVLHRYRHITSPSAFDRAMQVLSGEGDNQLIFSLLDSSISSSHVFRNTPTWDSAPLVHRLRSQLDSLQVESEIMFDSQKLAYDYFVSILYPFSWKEFLVRRVRHTFDDLGAFSESSLEASIEFVLSRLPHLRPVLACAWLRFVLNSIPTAGRLHDGLDHRCPWCYCAHACVTHVLTCENFESILMFMQFPTRWVKVQQFLDFSSASRLTPGSAIVHMLGLHLPYASASSSIPIVRSTSEADVTGGTAAQALHRSSCLAFEYICILLYVRMHAFTGMRRELTRFSARHVSLRSMSSSSSSSSSLSSSIDPDSTSDSATSSGALPLPGSAEYCMHEDNIEAAISAALGSLL